MERYVGDDDHSPIRRQILLGGFSAMLGWLLGGNSALAQIALKPPRTESKGDVLVCLFLRGGVDGLNMVIPYAEDAYYRNRPSLAIPTPNDRRRPANERAIALNDRFALHPALKPLYPRTSRANWRSSTLAVRWRNRVRTSKPCPPWNAALPRRKWESITAGLHATC